MKLKKIVVNNFRQFYGKQELTFAEGHNNITIIFGENGKGKTGIFRALLFSLFGNDHIEQDNKNVELHMVNLLALKENMNNPVKASVTIEFEAKGKDYKLIRSRHGMQLNSQITEKEGDVELYLYDEYGNYSPEPITDNDEIEVIINAIINESIKDFFFFDGEKIDTLSKTDTKVRKEVKNGIIKLLNIDKIEKSIELLSELYKEEKNRISKESEDLKLEEKQVLSENVSKEIYDLEEINNLKEINRIEGTKEISSIKDKLSANEGVKNIQEQYELIEQQRNIQLQLVHEKKEKMNKILINHTSDIILSDTYLSVNGYLSGVLNDQEDLVPIEIINKSLENMECATCGSDLSKHEEYRNNIVRLQKHYKRSSVTDFSNLISRHIYEVEESHKEVIETIRESLLEFREVKDQVEETEQTLDNLKDKMKNRANEQENLKNLQQSLDNKENELHQMIAEISYNNDLIEEKVKLKEKTDKEYKRLLSQSESLRIDSQVMDYIDSLQDSFKDIFENYSETMRQKLTNETTSIFKKLIDKKDKNLIQKININDKYEIEILGWDDVKITQDISQGQRQVVSLAFITSLAKVAAGDQKDINFPLFMDTPFGRISGTNRDQLIRSIPELTSQWILLLTDTELTRAEEVEFKNTGKLGRWYLLKHIKTYHTEIEEISINDSMATRG